jgi:hypothetical protein
MPTIFETRIKAGFLLAITFTKPMNVSIKQKHDKFNAIDIKRLRNR